VGRRGGRVGRDPHSLSGNTFVEVTLNRQLVATAQVPIRSETALAHPPVVELMVIGMKLGTAGEALTVDSVVEVLAVPSSKAKADEALIGIAAAGGYKHSMGVLGTLSDDIDDPIYGIRSPNRASRPADAVNGFINIITKSDDIDDPIYGIRSPNRASRPADDFDPLDIFEQRILNLPIDAGKQRRINRSSIDHHEHRSGKTASEAAHA